jgi:deoxycytidylate deaminase
MKIRYFDLAKKLTAKSTHHSHAIGCVIVQKNRVVSVGWNEMKTHSKSLHAYKSRHAEFNAILNTPLEDLQRATAYVYRAHKDGSLALAKPCSSCLKTLQLAGIKKVCYSTENGYMEENL